MMTSRLPTITIIQNQIIKRLMMLFERATVCVRVVDCLHDRR